MKKLLCCLLSMAIMLSTAIFSACSVIGDTIHLRYGEKYIEDWSVGRGELRYYYIFYKDGTGKFRKSSYTISFKYEIVDDDTIACFYDGVKYNSVDADEDSVSHGWKEIISCSKNVIMTATDGDIYIAESYLEEIPNFNK